MIKPLVSIVFFCAKFVQLSFGLFFFMSFFIWWREMGRKKHVQLQHGKPKKTAPLVHTQPNRRLKVTQAHSTRQYNTRLSIKLQGKTRVQEKCTVSREVDKTLQTSTTLGPPVPLKIVKGTTSDDEDDEIFYWKISVNPWSKFSACEPPM